MILLCYVDCVIPFFYFEMQTLLKSVLSSEEPSHTCGDIDSTVVRVLCTLLLIEVYLGTPEMPESPAAQAAAAARAQRLKGKDGGGGDVQDPVVVEVKVEVSFEVFLVI